MATNKVISSIVLTASECVSVYDKAVSVPFQERFEADPDSEIIVSVLEEYADKYQLCVLPNLLKGGTVQVCLANLSRGSFHLIKGQAFAEAVAVKKGGIRVFNKAKA